MYYTVHEVQFLKTNLNTQNGYIDIPLIITLIKSRQIVRDNLIEVIA
jgi:hypothetical protein